MIVCVVCVNVVSLSCPYVIGGVETASLRLFYEARRVIWYTLYYCWCIGWSVLRVMIVLHIDKVPDAEKLMRGAAYVNTVKPRCRKHFFRHKFYWEKPQKNPWLCETFKSRQIRRLTSFRNDFFITSTIYIWAVMVELGGNIVHPSSRQ